MNDSLNEENIVVLRAGSELKPTSGTYIEYNGYAFLTGCTVGKRKIRDLVSMLPGYNGSEHKTTKKHTISLSMRIRMRGGAAKPGNTIMEELNCKLPEEAFLQNTSTLPR